MKIKLPVFLILFFSLLHFSANATFTSDVKIYPNTAWDEHGVDIDVAFNGWIFESFTFDTGFSVMLSKDNGNTWTEFANARTDTSIRTYPQIRIAVAGTDTNNLYLFVLGVLYNSSLNSSEVFIDKYNARTGLFLGANYREGFNSAVRTLDIASDYKFPGSGASPFSVAFNIVRASGRDSLFFGVSTDGGNTYGPKQTVATTPGFIRNVSLCYSRSNYSSGGRYFMAWDDIETTAGKYGHVYVSHTSNSITATATAPFNLDSLNTPATGNCGRPSISAGIGSVNNDSGQATVAVVFDCNFNNSGDLDVVGCYNKTAPNSNHWNFFTIDTSIRICKNPSISFDPAINNFLVTYFDSTNQALPFLYNSFNLTSPSAWATAISNYSDDTLTLTNPFPLVVINPVYTQVAAGWSNNGIAYFDAEYRTVTTGILTVEEVGSFQLYPNPANGFINIAYQLNNSEEIKIDLYDISGRLIAPVITQKGLSGNGNFVVDVSTVAPGMYEMVIQTAHSKTGHKIVVTH